MPITHPPLSSYFRGDRVMVILPGHPRYGDVGEVFRYSPIYEELVVRFPHVRDVEAFASATSLRPVRPPGKRPVSPIFYSLQT